MASAGRWGGSGERDGEEYARNRRFTSLRRDTGSNLADLGRARCAPVGDAGGERLRQFLRKHGIIFQRTTTWKVSNDPDRDITLVRIEYVSSTTPDRVFAFDGFGLLTVRPHLGADWVTKSHPDRLPANYHKLCGVRQFHGCYSMGDDTLWGVVRERKSAVNTLAALKKHAGEGGLHFLDYRDQTVPW